MPIQLDASWCYRDLSESLISKPGLEALILTPRGERELPYLGVKIQNQLTLADKVTLLRGA